MEKFDFARMRYLIRKKQETEFEIEKERSKAEKITTTITGMPHGSGDQSKIERSAIKLADMIEAYKELICELEAMKKTISPLIDRVEDIDVRAVMRLRYLNEYPISVIADAINRCERQTYNLVKKGEETINNFSEFQ